VLSNPTLVDATANAINSGQIVAVTLARTMASLDDRGQKTRRHRLIYDFIIQASRTRITKRKNNDQTK